MPVRVELTSEAVADLGSYAETEALPKFLTKLIRLEMIGKEVGIPLGRDLAGFRKIVVGNRDWRIVFQMSADDTTAKVWVIGDRGDNACYEEATRRVQQLGKSHPGALSLAETILALMDRRRRNRSQRRR